MGPLPPNVAFALGEAPTTAMLFGKNSRSNSCDLSADNDDLHFCFQFSLFISLENVKEIARVGVKQGFDVSNVYK